MSVTIPAKLNKAATEFQAGESTGFGLRLGQQYYDRETKKKEWTNYEAVIFAKAQAQIDFYRQNLVEGAIVCVSGKEQKIRTFDGQNGQVLTIEILNATLDNVWNVGEGQPAPQQTPQQGFNQPASQPKPQPQSFGANSNGGFATPPQNQAPSFDPRWNDVVGTAMTNGARMDQIQKKYNGDFDAAWKGGAIEKKQQTPNFDDFDSDIPF